MANAHTALPRDAAHRWFRWAQAAVLGLVVAFAGMPAPSQAAEGSLTTLFTAGNSFAGNTFDIVPQVKLMITGFDVHLDPTGTPTTITIYWRDGTAQGNQTDPAGWTVLGSDTVNPAGLTNPTFVNIGGLTLLAGQTYGFYVDVESYPSASIQYTNGGPTTFSNADLELTTFHGKGNPAFTGADFAFRQWNGTVYYTTVMAEIPTLSATSLGLLALLLTGTGFLMLRRRARD